jgi:hypothetical protein
LRRSGEIGRRTGLKIQRRKACRFDSGLRYHQKSKGLRSFRSPFGLYPAYPLLTTSDYTSKTWANTSHDDNHADDVGPRAVPGAGLNLQDFAYRTTAEIKSHYVRKFKLAVLQECLEFVQPVPFLVKP